MNKVLNMTIEEDMSPDFYHLNSEIFTNPPSKNQKQIIISGKRIMVFYLRPLGVRPSQLVSTKCNHFFNESYTIFFSEKEKGLMFRKKLDKNSGMLFVYGSKRYLYYYMKNTFIPLDIAFIDEYFTIIDIQSMEPLDETSIRSAQESMYALEVNRGFFDRVGLKVGDKIKLLSAVPYDVE